MKYLFDEHLNYLSLYNLRRIGLDVLSMREGVKSPTNKALTDIRKAKAENKKLDDFIKDYIEENEHLDEIPF